MIITAALSWWDESPEDLDRCVRNMANIADRVVAVDGAYKRYPGATVLSPKGQAEAIKEAADSVGIECIIHYPDRLWAGQVEKRTHLISAAAEGSDWIAVLDTDHIVTADKKRVRKELASLDDYIDVVHVDFVTPANENRVLKQSAATNWHGSMSNTTIKIGAIFRSLGDMRVEGCHWVYSGLKNGRRTLMLYGVPGTFGYVLKSRYSVEHRTLYRDDEHIRANRAFCNDRIKVVEMTGQEDDIPGLPDPVWDFDTIPY